MKVAKPGFQHPKKLWEEYWDCYNTIKIPLRDEDAYFTDALAAAGRAENREHLEELLAEKSRERRRDLEGLVQDVALASIYRHRHPSMSDAVRKSAHKIGQSGSLDSFLQFVCGVAFGWPDGYEEPEPAQIDAATGEHDGPVDADDDIRSDGNCRAPGFDNDRIEYENGLGCGMFSPDPMVDLASDMDDAWNQMVSCQRVEECSETDGEVAGRLPLPPPSSSERVTPTEDDPTPPSEIEDTRTVPDQPGREARRTPSANPERPSPAPKVHTPSRPAEDTSAERVPSLASDATSPIEDTELSQGSHPRMPRPSAEPPDVKAIGKPRESMTSESFTGHTGKSDAHCWSGSPRDTGRRKRELHVDDDDECEDAGRPRRKRRATDGKVRHTGLRGRQQSPKPADVRAADGPRASTSSGSPAGHDADPSAQGRGSVSPAGGRGTKRALHGSDDERGGVRRDRRERRATDG